VSRFTGGQWYADNYDVKSSCCEIALAKVAVFNEGKANANVMAAAPDMYEALESVIMMVNAGVIRVRPSDKPTFLNALESWNQALAKADGKG
jgi:hypothetical protein